MGLFSLLFPDKCIFCDEIIHKGAVCDKCKDVLPITEGLRGVQTGEFFDKCVSPFYYTGIVRDSILSYKFRHKRGRGAKYALFCADMVNTYLTDRFDVITWSPISRVRFRERGFDQSELIAKELARLLDMPWEKLLIKIRHTERQSSFADISQRRANVSGAFRVSGDVYGKRILLVDDIITTGATLSECSRTLLMAGAESVVCCTIAAAHSKK